MGIDIIGWLVIGLIAGWLASMIMGRGGYGIIGDIVVGVIGAFIGGFVARMLNVAGPTAQDATNWASFIFALIGAIILIAVLRALSGGRTRL
jgi:uncharacterized membrane protein YeaQ/YmgE (transglycosylase-associated protein family)